MIPNPSEGIIYGGGGFGFVFFQPSFMSKKNLVHIVEKQNSSENIGVTRLKEKTCGSRIRSYRILMTVNSISVFYVLGGFYFYYLCYNRDLLLKPVTD